MPDPQTPAGTQDCPWDDLVVSILSVNQYSLERTYVLLQGLREQKVTDPRSLASWGSEEFEMRLRAAGCDRGSLMTNLFAHRLAALGALVRRMGIDECEKVIGSQDSTAIENLLLPVKGIGPVVLRNCYSLRQIRFDE
jgi:hypothetical protein